MKSLYYNGTLLYNNNVIWNNKKINVISLLKKINFIDTNISDNYIKMFKEANFFYNTTAYIIDRTNANPFYVNLLADKIPEEKNDIGLSFRNLCFKRADELLSKGKRINIMWSGGIDSTAVLFTLMNRANDLSQLRVLLTPDSILESGNLFDLHIKNNLSFVLYEKVGKKSYFNRKEFKNFDVNKELITGGNMSDHLNSLLRLNIPFDEKYWHLDYQEMLMQHTNKNVIDFLNKSVQAFPKKIKTYIDFLKFYGFNFHWHKDKYKNNCEADKKYFKCFEYFFDTNYFQRWSIWNKESDILPNVLKQPQRDLIYELTKDKLYSYQKQKTMSGPSLFTNFDWAFLMDNGETIYLKDLINKQDI